MLHCAYMRVEKLNHSCVLVETDGVRLLADPGNLSIAEQQEMTDIDIVLYTHEHGDHLHLESLQQRVSNNPQATVVCNSGVGSHLEGIGIPYHVLEGESQTVVAGVSLRARDSKHAEIFEDFGQVQHTGYLVAGRLFLAGDSYEVPEFPVEILAPAIVAPFCAVRDTVHLVQTLQPAVAVSMHDGQLNEAGLSLWHGLIERLLADDSTTFVPLPAGAQWEG